MSDIKAGKYQGKLLDYGIGKTKAGLPQILLKFEIRDGEGNAATKMWFGSLKEGKAREITLSALLVCGFSGDDLAVLSDGVGNGALDTDKLVDLTVVEEPDQSGKTISKIRWINEPGSGAIREKVERGEAQSILPSLGGELAALRASKKPAPAVSSMPSDIEVPF